MKLSNTISGHLRYLCESIGSRPAGSQANAAAVEFAECEFEAHGFSACERDFDVIDWRDSGAELTINGRRAAVSAAPWSLPCALSGQIIILDSVEKLRAADIRGKIAVLCGSLLSGQLMPKNFPFWNPDEHKEIIALLENGRPSAVITGSLSPGCFVPLIADGDFTVPCAVTDAAGIALLRAAAEGSVGEDIVGMGAIGEASLTLDTERIPSRARNVVASFRGGPRKVCFCAHIDTQFLTPGAADNAGGVAVLLALASELKRRGLSSLPFTVEFVLFNGEEYFSAAGETAYSAEYLHNPGEYVCAVNVDGAGIRGSAASYSFYECPAAVTDAFKSAAAGWGSTFVPSEPWYQGDHLVFAGAGIPAAAITSSCFLDGSVSELHTAADVPELVDTQILEEVVLTLADFIRRLAVLERGR